MSNELIVISNDGETDRKSDVEDDTIISQQEENISPSSEGAVKLSDEEEKQLSVNAVEDNDAEKIKISSGMSASKKEISPEKIYWKEISEPVLFSGSDGTVKLDSDGTLHGIIRGVKAQIKMDVNKIYRVGERKTWYKLEKDGKLYRAFKIGCDQDFSTMGEATTKRTTYQNLFQDFDGNINLDMDSEIAQNNPLLSNLIGKEHEVLKEKLNISTTTKTNPSIAGESSKAKTKSPSKDLVRESSSSDVAAEPSFTEVKESSNKKTLQEKDDARPSERVTRSSVMKSVVKEVTGTSEGSSNIASEELTKRSTNKRFGKISPTDEMETKSPRRSQRK